MSKIKDNSVIKHQHSNEIDFLKGKRKNIKNFFSIVLTCIIVFSLFGCQKTLHGTDELIEKAREVIPVDDAENIDIQYAGNCLKEDKALFWFVAESGLQEHYYLPMECTFISGGGFIFEKAYEPVELRKDIVGLQWNGRYAFCVNNTDCVTVRIIDASGINETTINKEKEGAYPFCFYNELIPADCFFFDENGNEI